MAMIYYVRHKLVERKCLDDNNEALINTVLAVISHPVPQGKSGNVGNIGDGVIQQYTATGGKPYCSCC